MEYILTAEAESVKIRTKITSLLWGLNFVSITLLLVYFFGAGPLSSFILLDSFIFGISLHPAWVIWLTEIIITTGFIYGVEKNIKNMRWLLLLWFLTNVLENFVDISHFPDLHMQFEEISFCLIYAYGAYVTYRNLVNMKV